MNGAGRRQHMSDTPVTSKHTVGVRQSKTRAAPAPPCVLVLFGASGDLAKRLLMPALYNLACDGLLPKNFAIVGVAREGLSTDDFKARMTEDIQKFMTRRQFDPAVWKNFVAHLHYTAADFADPAAFTRIA